MLLDLEALRAAPVVTDPFPHLVVRQFLPQAGLEAVNRDFPAIAMPGLFPVDEVKGGAAFTQTIADLNSPEVRAIMGEKFGVDLAQRPTMTTVRARARATDGKIHTDADFKLVTLLLYLNDSWPHKEGWLRALRSHNLEDYASEVPPEGGLLFAFRCTPTALHGHTSFEGVRRYLMMNYVTDHSALKREIARHRFTAKLKKVKTFFGFSSKSEY